MDVKPNNDMNNMPQNQNNNMNMQPNYDMNNIPQNQNYNIFFIKNFIYYFY